MNPYFFLKVVTSNERVMQSFGATIICLLIVLYPSLPLAAQPFHVSIPGTAVMVDGGRKKVSVQNIAGEQHIRAEAGTTVILSTPLRLHPSSSAEHKIQRLVVHFRTNTRGANPTIQSVELREGNSSKFKLSTNLDGDYTTKEIPKVNAWNFPVPVSVSTQSMLRLEVRYPSGFEGLSDAGEFILTDVKVYFPLKIRTQSGTVADKSVPRSLDNKTSPPSAPPPSAPATNGTILYAVSQKNELLWYNHLGKDDGSARWSASAGITVGNGWSFQRIFSGGAGIFYVVTDDGDILWYKHDGFNDGTVRWAFPEGKKIGTGWAVFDTIIAAGRGVFYMITGDGDLFWFRHTGFRDGTDQWASEEIKKIGTGWGDFKQVFSGGNGVLYAIATNGNLLWYRHDGYNDGTDKWAASEGKLIGTGWNFNHIFSGGDGIIYVIKDDGDLWWYKHTGFKDGTMNWASPVAKKVGYGWASLKQVFPH